MITVKQDNIFILDTSDTSYIFRVLGSGHLEHLYYGNRLSPQDDYTAFYTKNNSGMGSLVTYDDTDDKFSLDTVTLEYSGIGKGDFRHSPIELKMPDGTFVCDFVFEGYEIKKGCGASEGLPLAYTEVGGADCETLEVRLKDRVCNVGLTLVYNTFDKNNVIARRAVLTNHNDKNSLDIRKFMSFMVDLPQSDYDLVTFDGGWIKETHKHRTALGCGIYVNSSTTGASSNRHNAGVVLAKQNTDEEHGECIGVNLIYSGNHYTACEVSNHGFLRVMSGINPHCFEWTLGKGESFETPQAVLTYSDGGFSGMSRNMHGFVNDNIVRGEHKGKDRPVLLNDWEAFQFDFTARKLLRLARAAKKIGIELFVLDDGWFGSRDSDRAGLGDIYVNKKKLRGGLGRLSKKINRLGMQFGLWFEPEMVNPDSNLYRAHPEYAVSVPGRKPSPGRNQLVLDLTRKEVRDYLVTSVSKVLAQADITYVKWDNNRHISDMFSPALTQQGRFFHQYILGLYDILGRITSAFPHVLFESCSSGGNRFDLGMLCFTPQIWASDDTDPIERIKIQEGLSYLYPLSTIGAHVSQSPHQQTLRATNLASRFNTAAFGLLGYELDLKHLTRAEKKETAAQIAFYKQNRRLFQYGNFLRGERSADKTVWNVVSPDGSQSVVGNFQTRAQASPPYETLHFSGLRSETLYNVDTLPQGISIKTFGGLIKYALPLKLNPDGFILRAADKLYRLPNAVEHYRARGDVLGAGVRISQQFMGTWYNPSTRLMLESGSQLYKVEKVE